MAKDFDPHIANTLFEMSADVYFPPPSVQAEVRERLAPHAGRLARSAYDPLLNAFSHKPHESLVASQLQRFNEVFPAVHGSLEAMDTVTELAEDYTPHAIRETRTLPEEQVRRGVLIGSTALSFVGKQFMLQPHGIRAGIKHFGVIEQDDGGKTFVSADTQERYRAWVDTAKRPVVIHETVRRLQARDVEYFREATTRLRSYVAGMNGLLAQAGLDPSLLQTGCSLSETPRLATLAEQVALEASPDARDSLSRTVEYIARRVGRHLQGAHYIDTDTRARVSRGLQANGEQLRHYFTALLTKHQ